MKLIIKDKDRFFVAMSSSDKTYNSYRYKNLDEEDFKNMITDNGTIVICEKCNNRDKDYYTSRYIYTIRNKFFNISKRNFNKRYISTVVVNELHKFLKDEDFLDDNGVFVVNIILVQGKKAFVLCKDEAVIEIADYYTVGIFANVSLCYLEDKDLTVEQRAYNYLTNLNKYVENAKKPYVCIDSKNLEFKNLEDLI